MEANWTRKMLALSLSLSSRTQNPEKEPGAEEFKAGASGFEAPLSTPQIPVPPPDEEGSGFLMRLVFRQEREVKWPPFVLLVTVS